MNKNRRKRFLKVIARILFPKPKVKFEVDDNEVGIYVANHAQIYGPLFMGLYFPKDSAYWIINNALDESKAKPYAYHDACYGNSRKHKSWYRFLARIIASLLPKMLRCVDYIPVYHDKRIEETFTKSIEAMKNNKNIVIFGESAIPYSPYINNLQTGFLNIASAFYKETGKRIKIYPVYLEKKNKVVLVGSPISYDPSINLVNQMRIVNEYICSNITRLAQSLTKPHPIPFYGEKWYGGYSKYTYNYAKYWQMIDEDESFLKHKKGDF